MTATAVIDRVTTAVDYLRVTVGGAGDDWIPCGPLVTDPDVLGALVASTKEGRGTDRDDVATSLFVQGYGFRIASLAIGAWIMGDAILDVDPALCSIAIGRHRPNAVALDEARLSSEAGVDGLHRSLVEGHLAPLVATAHLSCRVGEPLLWGNIAASCASSFGAFAGALEDRRPEIRERAHSFFATARREVGDAGRLVPLDAGRWAWERKSCCLWYQTDSGFKCEDCSLWTDEERAARYASAAEAG